MTKQYGLIGYPLQHSFSPDFFKKKFDAENIDASYKTYPLTSIKEFCDLIGQYEFSGLNVTIPYKQSIIPYLDDIDDIADRVGAVNTITFTNGITKGYNTDVYGFEKSLIELIGNPSAITAAFILGTGGASLAVQYVLEEYNIPYFLVSRNDGGDLNYDELNDKVLFGQANLIINTTPLGMAPDTDTCPQIPYHWLNEKYFLYDLVYNPEKTIFLSEGIKKGCKIKNGYDMLILQAEKAWQIWNPKVM